MLLMLILRHPAPAHDFIHSHTGLKFECWQRSALPTQRAPGQSHNPANVQPESAARPRAERGS